MYIMKRSAALALTAVLCLLSLTGCAQEAESLSLSVCVGAAPVNLDPIYAQNPEDQTILAHLYENLCRLSVDVSGQQTIAHGMAKSIDETENRDGTVTYTFRLRSAKWSDGRNVRASDFVYAWRRLANPVSASPFASLLSTVAGYAEARASGDMELLQVSAKNDSTFEVTLSGPTEWFLREVCTSVATVPLREDVVQQLKTAAAEEAEATNQPSLRWWYDPTALVTNGPYTVSSYTREALTAAANERYYDSLAGPDTLTFRFAGTPEDAWSLYEAQEIDMISPLPEDQLALLAQQEDWTPLPKLGTYTLLINSGQWLFGSPLVRQALCLSLDRTALAETAGPSSSAAAGLVPPGVVENDENDEDFRTCGGPLLELERDTEDQSLARQILAEAGYDSGEDLGELEYLYVDQGANGAVAEALCRMWQETLNAQVTPKAVTAQELLAALRAGEYTLAGAWLSASGNDAECMLNQWISAGPENYVRYSNSAYDTLLAVTVSADGTARLGCLHDAEELLLLDCALAPLYTQETGWTLREPLTGVCRDARGWFSFSNVTVKHP